MATHGHEVSTGARGIVPPDSSTLPDQVLGRDEAGSNQPVLEVLALALLTMMLIWSLWPGLEIMVRRWSLDARYSHGFLVPIYSLGLYGWLRGQPVSWTPANPKILGIGFLAVGAVIQLLGAYVGSTWLILHSILGYLLAAACLLGRGSALPRSLPAVLFLTFMIPLPYSIETLLGPALQSLATRLSTYSLQTLGLMAFARGYVIHIDKHKIGVVEACSGLSMLMTFVAVSVAVALVMRRSWLDRLMLVAASLPVALAANTARIVLTGFLYVRASSRAAETFYHDLAGWLMIPFALALLWCLAWIWDWLLVIPPNPQQQAVFSDLLATRTVESASGREFIHRGTTLADHTSSSQQQGGSHPAVQTPTIRKYRR